MTPRLPPRQGTRLGLVSLGLLVLLAGARADSAPLTSAEVARRVLQHNPEVQERFYAIGVARAGIDAAEGAFEPALVLDARRSAQRVHNSTEESLARSNLDIYRSETAQFGVAVETLLPGQGNLSLGYHLSDQSSNLISAEKEVTGSWELRLVQPLLKGGGALASSAATRLATQERDVALQRYRQSLAEQLGEALDAYYEQSAAGERLELRRQAQALTAELLAEQQQRFDLGLVPAAERERAEARHALQRSQTLLAEQAQTAAQARLARLLGADPEVDTPPWDYAPQADAFEPQAELRISLAHLLRPELRIEQLQRASERLRLAYARDQRQPQLDLTLAYGRGGLGNNSRDALAEGLTSDYPTWEVGLALRVPLQGGRSASAEVSAAEYRKMAADTRWQRLTRQVDEEVSEAVARVVSSRQELAGRREIDQQQERLWRAEQRLAELGRSSVVEATEQQLHWLQSREELLDSALRLRKAETHLRQLDGSLLEAHGLERLPNPELPETDL